MASRRQRAYWGLIAGLFVCFCLPFFLLLEHGQFGILLAYFAFWFITFFLSIEWLANVSDSRKRSGEFMLELRLIGLLMLIIGASGFMVAGHYLDFQSKSPEYNYYVTGLTHVPVLLSLAVGGNMLVAGIANPADDAKKE